MLDGLLYEVSYRYRTHSAHSPRNPTVETREAQRKVTTKIPTASNEKVSLTKESMVTNSLGLSASVRGPRTQIPDERKLINIGFSDCYLGRIIESSSGYRGPKHMSTLGGGGCQFPWTCDKALDALASPGFKLMTAWGLASSKQGYPARRSKFFQGRPKATADMLC